MKTLVLFQSGLLIAVFIMLNLPPELSGYVLPDEFMHMRDLLVAVMRLTLWVAGLWFVFRMLTYGKKADEPGAAFWSALVGPVVIDLLASGRSWFILDPGGIILIALFLIHIVVVIVLSAKSYGLARLVFYTAVYATSYAAVMYVYAGRHAWLLPAAALMIITPEVLAYKLRSSMKLAV
jgi:hypothetical protein